MPVITILSKLMDNAALQPDDRKYLKYGKHQGRLRTAVNVYIANEYTEHLAGNEQDIQRRWNMPLVRAFIAQRSSLANRWLNRTHLDSNARRLTN